MAARGSAHTAGVAGAASLPLRLRVLWPACTSSRSISSWPDAKAPRPCSAHSTRGAADRPAALTARSPAAAAPPARAAVHPELRRRPQVQRPLGSDMSSTLVSMESEPDSLRSALSGPGRRPAWGSTRPTSAPSLRRLRTTSARVISRWGLGALPGDGLGGGSTTCTPRPGLAGF